LPGREAQEFCQSQGRSLQLSIGTNGPAVQGWDFHCNFVGRATENPRERLYVWRDEAMIRKLKSGQYRLYSRKVDAKTGRRRNLGTFSTREAAEQHEREVQYFKRH
jgi:hypothetical protein